MKIWRAFCLAPACIGLVSCATTGGRGTLAELEQVEPDTEEVYLDDSLTLAAQSYRRYLEETPQTARTPEAMRRLADLQIEQEYGVIGGGQLVEMSAPDSAAAPAPAEKIAAVAGAKGPVEPSESALEFERRASLQQISTAEFTGLP